MLNLEFEGGGEIKGKNNNASNSIKGEQHGKSLYDSGALWYQKKFGWFMLHFKKFLLLKGPTVCQNYIEITSINNEEIIYTFLNILKYLTFLSIWLTFTDLISEWQFEQTKKLLHMIFIKTIGYIAQNTFLCLFLAMSLTTCKIPLVIASSIY